MNAGVLGSALFVILIAVAFVSLGLFATNFVRLWMRVHGTDSMRANVFPFLLLTKLVDAGEAEIFRRKAVRYLVLFVIAGAICFSIPAVLELH